MPDNLFAAAGVEHLTEIQKEATDLNNKIEESKLKIQLLDTSKKDKELKKDVASKTKEYTKLVKEKEDKEAEVKKGKELKQNTIKSIMSRSKVHKEEDLVKMDIKALTGLKMELDSQVAFPFKIYVFDEEVKLPIFKKGETYTSKQVREAILENPKYAYLDKAVAVYNQKHNQFIFSIVSSQKGGEIEFDVNADAMKSALKNMVFDRCNLFVKKNKLFIETRNNHCSVKNLIAKLDNVNDFNLTLCTGELKKIFNVINQEEIVINIKQEIFTQDDGTEKKEHTLRINHDLGSNETHSSKNDSLLTFVKPSKEAKEINASDLVKVLKIASYATSDKRPDYESVSFDGKTASATDSFRAIKIKADFNFSGAIFPSAVLTALNGFKTPLISIDSRVITIAENDNIVNLSLSSLTPPDISKLVDRKTERTFKIERLKLLGLIKKIRTWANSTIVISFNIKSNESSIIVSTEDDKVCYDSKLKEINNFPKNYKLKVSTSFFIDLLENVEEEIIEFGITEDNKIIIIKDNITTAIHLCIIKV